ncbi:MAG: OB-fold nucleic acid binding domain-containing protein, partial [Gemmatimonadota bacterium]
MSAPFAHIAELHRHEDRDVTLLGWLTHRRSSGKIAFLMLRDGTGVVQAVLTRQDVPEPVWVALDTWHTESSLRVVGLVRKDARAPGGFELAVRDVEVIGASSPDYPIQPKEHGVDFLLDHRHLWIRSPRQASILRVRDEVIKAIRDFFYDRHFVLIDSPILTGAIGEAAAGGLFETEYFDLGKAYLAQTGQLYVE